MQMDWEPKINHLFQNWQHGLESMQGGLALAGPSHVQPVTGGHGNPFTGELWGSQPYQPVQTLQVLQPNLQAMSPSMQAMSPNMQPMSPNMQPLSPNMQQAYAAERMSPNMSVMSPHAQTMSPNMQVMSPMGRISPNMPQNMGHISPNLVQQQPTYVQVSWDNKFLVLLQERLLKPILLFRAFTDARTLQTHYFCTYIHAHHVGV